MIWLLALAAGAAVFIVRTPVRVNLWAKVPAQLLAFNADAADDAQPQQGSREIVVDQYLGETKGPWLCKKGGDVPIPDITQIVPPQLLAAGGPIAIAAKTMLDIVRNIFKQIGASKVCTVRGGEYVPIVFWNRLPAREVHVSFEAMYGGAPAGMATFASTPNKVSDTIDLPLTDEIVEPSPRQVYLMRGGVPPGDLWPHDPGTPKWQAYVEPAYDVPRAAVVRSANGDLLTLYVWIPPRAPRSHNTVWGVYKIDHPVTWRITWWVA